MRFFPELPPEPPRPEPQQYTPPAWLRPPRDEIPVAVPLSRCLARTEIVALHLLRLDVYRGGVSIVMQLDVQRPAESTDDEAFALLRGGRGGPVRLGVTQSDGRSCIVGVDKAVALALRTGDAPPTPFLAFHGGGGSSGDASQYTLQITAWLWPTPPDGLTTLHFAAERAGIPEGSTDITLSLRELRDEVLSLWDASPEASCADEQPRM